MYIINDIPGPIPNLWDREKSKLHGTHWIMSNKSSPIWIDFKYCKVHGALFALFYALINYKLPLKRKKARKT